MNFIFLFSQALCNEDVGATTIIFKNEKDSHYGLVSFQKPAEMESYAVYKRTGKGVDDSVPVHSDTAPPKKRNAYKLEILGIDDLNAEYSFCFFGPSFDQKGKFSETFKYDTDGNKYKFAREFNTPFYKEKWFMFGGIVFLLVLLFALVFVIRARTPKAE